MKRRMSDVSFESIRPLLKMSEQRIDAARCALVDGQTLATIAQRHGVTRQSISDAVGLVWRMLEKQQAGLAAAQGMHEGWEVVTLVAPPDLISRFKREIEEAKKSNSR